MSQQKASEPPSEEIQNHQAIELIQRQIEDADALLAPGGWSTDEFGNWELATRIVLDKVYGENSATVSRVMDDALIKTLPANRDEAWFAHEYAKRLGSMVSKLRRLLKTLQG